MFYIMVIVLINQEFDTLTKMKCGAKTFHRNWYFADIEIKLVYYSTN
jgi:hypothetical protein